MGGIWLTVYHGTNWRDIWLTSGHQLEGYMAYIRAPTGWIWLILGHQLKRYGLNCASTEKTWLIRAPTEGIWLMLGHQVKGYGLWEGTQFRDMA